MFLGHLPELAVFVSLVSTRQAGVAITVAQPSTMSIFPDALARTAVQVPGQRTILVGWFASS